MPTTPSPYYAPTFFSPFYFAPLATSGASPAGPAVTHGDGDAYSAIIAALRLTGEFADVLFGTTPDRRPAGAALWPVAVLTPTGWSEVDDADPVVLLRQVSYTLTLVVRGDDPLASYGDLDRLTRLAQDVIDGADLGGNVLPPLTVLRRGFYDGDPVRPEQSVTLHGEFAYLVPSFTGHSTHS